MKKLLLLSCLCLLLSAVCAQGPIGLSSVDVGPDPVFVVALVVMVTAVFVYLIHRRVRNARISEKARLYMDAMLPRKRIFLTL